MGETIRGFYHLSRSWYADANIRNINLVDEVMFGMYEPENGTDGEIAMRWYNIESRKCPSACLETFHDAFAVLEQFSDVIKELSLYDDSYIQPKEFCELLIKCGFTDLTKEVRE